jgi:predicted GH43/DUF377 family glycosyl hydrolase
MADVMSKLRAQRIAVTPIVAPGAVPGYGPIFNAGLIRHDEAFHLFARGVRHGYRRNDGPGPRFLDYVCDILMFRSSDGTAYDFVEVLAKASPDGVWSYEDPRVQRIRSGGTEHVLMTYTDLPPPESHEPWRVGCQRLRYHSGCFELNHDSRRVIGPPGIPDKDAVVFNLADDRVGLIHRVAPDIQLAIFDSLDELVDPPDGYWADHLADLESHVILRPSTRAATIGAGAPPLDTPQGLLLFFHERDGDGVYTGKVALMDRSTGSVSAVLSDPILVPELAWEVDGDVPNVVFVQGAHRLPDGTIYLTYGAADRAVGAAVIDEGALLAALS